MLEIASLVSFRKESLHYSHHLLNCNFKLIVF
jgi:hypothetical protein